MLKNKINNIFLFFWISFFLSSCETDVDIIHEAENFPIIYSLLNPDDSVHYVRIQKTFTGYENALFMAKIPDSIYYRNAVVKLETWDNNYKIQTILLEPSADIIKDKGLFASNEHKIYKTSETLLGDFVSLSVDLDRKSVV